MKTATVILKAAINHSIHENRIVTVDYDGDISDCLADLNAVYHGVIHYDQENDGSYDVWGWTYETPENDQEWRLRVKCS